MKGKNLLSNGTPRYEQHQRDQWDQRDQRWKWDAIRRGGRGPSTAGFFLLLFFFSVAVIKRNVWSGEEEI